MSYLRPTCSDAAARVTTLSVSRFVPAFRHNDVQTEDATTSTPNAFFTEPARPHRLPSQRPLDRRWDESRGLVFSQRRTASKNHTWTPRRDIAFASSIGQRRGYAMRKLNVGSVPVPPKPKASAEQSARVYGSTLPDLELPDEPIDAPPTASKGSKQERFEREIKQRDAEIEKLKDESAELESRNLELQQIAAQLEKQKASALKDKRSALEDLQKEKESVVEQLEKADAKYKKLHQERDAIYKKHSTQREDLTEEIAKREKSLVKQKTEFEDQMSKRIRVTDQKFAEANQHDAKVKQSEKTTREKQEARSKELDLREDRTRKRKMERHDYNAYRHQYTNVHDERKILEDRLGLIRKRLTREREELDIMVSKAGGSDRKQTQSASAQLKDLEEKLDRLRNDLMKTDISLRTGAHASRIQTKTVRFDDISLAASSMSATLYSTSINPLRSVKSRIQADIEDVGKQIDAASNATLREELAHQKDALFAELAALQSAIDLAYYDQSTQVLETLKMEPYSHKAVHMRTMDTRTQLDQKSQAMYEKKDATPYRVLAAERAALEKQANLEKQRAVVLEISGQHVQDERQLDEMILQRIASFVDKMQVKRAKMVGDYKAARAATKRAHPARPAPVTTRAQTMPTPRKAFQKMPAESRKAGRQARYRSRKSDMAEYTAKCKFKEELRTLLRESKASPDAATRTKKVHQYNQASIEVADIRIRLMKAQLIAEPKTKSDYAFNEKREAFIVSCVTARANAKVRLDAHLEPDTKFTPEQQLEAQKLIEAETGQARTEQKELAGLRSQLSDLRKSGSSADRTLLAPLEQKIAAMKLQIKNQNLQMRAVLLAEPPVSAEVNDGSDGKNSGNGKVRDGVNLQVRSGGRTRVPRRARESGFKTLNFAPSSPTLATHTSLASRELHDNLLWASSMRHIEDHLRPSNGAPGSTRAVSFTESDESVPWTSRAETHDTGAITPAEYLTSEGSPDINTEVARDDSNNAKSHAQAASASLSAETPIQTASNNNIINQEQEHSNTMAEPEEETVLGYEIPVKDKRNALIASRNSTASFWRYNLYRNAAGQIPTRHYCTTFEQTEAQIASFLGEKVVGFDLEWEKRKSKPGEDSNKRCVSLMQVAAEGKVALFHLALFKGGDSAKELLPPALRAFLENPDIIKTGVNIGGDATRLRNCFGVEMRGNIELSHLYKVVTYGEAQPEKVNRGLYALANQVKEVLHLPLAKGEVRTSSWSKRLNVQQIDYAVSDAYAGLRLYHELERRRKAMVSKPPRPAFHELGIPLMLGGGKLAPSALRRPKEPAVAQGEVVEEAEPTEESAALQEQDDGAASEESSDDFFDTAEDLEAFDAYVESQDAAAGASLPEITYPTLPPLEPVSNYSSQSSSSSSNLPSDPLAAPPPTFPSTPAATADAWVTTWQSQLPSAYNLRVSRPHLRAYYLWHHQGYSLQETAALLRKEPLALSTVVSYVAEVLQKEGLEFDEARVKEIRARLPSSVRGRYGRLYAKGDGE